MSAGPTRITRWGAGGGADGSPSMRTRRWAAARTDSSSASGARSKGGTSTTESARRAAEVSRELRTEMRRHPSPGRSGAGGGSGGGGGARPLLGGPLAASRALAEGLSPAEVYMRLAQGEGLPSSAGGGGSRLSDSSASGSARALGSTSARGVRRQPLPPQPEMNVTDAVCLIQRRTRGILGRKRGMEQKAAYALQRVARRWIARRRRAKLRREAKNRARLYSLTSGGSAGQPASLRGRWAEKSTPVSSLPAQRSKAAPPSPRGRPAHQKLYENAEEKTEKMRQLKQEHSERDERAHVATCTFSPAQLTKSQKYKDVKPRIDASWSKPPPRPLSPRNGNGRGANQAAADEAGNQKAPSNASAGPPPPVDVSDAQPDDDDWTTVATTASPSLGRPR